MFIPIPISVPKPTPVYIPVKRKQEEYYAPQQQAYPEKQPQIHYYQSEPEKQHHPKTVVEPVYISVPYGHGHGMDYGGAAAAAGGPPPMYAPSPSFQSHQYTDYRSSKPTRSEDEYELQGSASYYPPPAPTYSHGPHHGSHHGSPHQPPPPPPSPHHPGYGFSHPSQPDAEDSYDQTYQPSTYQSPYYSYQYDSSNSNPPPAASGRSRRYVAMPSYTPMSYGSNPYYGGYGGYTYYGSYYPSSYYASSSTPYGSAYSAPSYYTPYTAASEIHLSTISFPDTEIKPNLVKQKVKSPNIQLDSVTNRKSDKIVTQETLPVTEALLIAPYEAPFKTSTEANGRVKDRSSRVHRST